MSVVAWEEALTAMEDELDAHEEAVRTGNPTTVPTFEPPADLGALPPQLAERVSHLVSRVKLLTTFVEYQLTATESDLAHLERNQKSRTAGTTQNGHIALYLDSSV